MAKYIMALDAGTTVGFRSVGAAATGGRFLMLRSPLFYHNLPPESSRYSVGGGAADGNTENGRKHGDTEVALEVRLRTTLHQSPCLRVSP